MPAIRYRAALICCGLLVLNGTAVGQTVKQGSEATKDQPVPAMQHRRSPKKLELLNADGAVITFWKPDLSKRPLEPKMDVITVPPTGVDNYHAIIVEQDWGDSLDAIIRYEYMRGKPSGESPTKLTSAVKTYLEIVPDPLPREHHRYYSGDKIAFLVRYQDQYLSGQPVVMTTGNGSTVNAVSDNNGRVVMTIPDDFDDVIAGERDRRSTAINITTSHVVSGKQYNTTLSSEYRLTPVHWQSKSWGLAAAGIGFLFGGFVTHRVGRSRQERAQ